MYRRRVSLTDRYRTRVERRLQHRLLKQDRARAGENVILPLRSCDPHDVARDVAHELEAREIALLLIEHPEWSGFAECNRLHRQTGNTLSERFHVPLLLLLALPIEIYGRDLQQGISVLEIAQRHLAACLERWLAHQQ